MFMSYHDFWFDLNQVWDYQTNSCVQTLEGHAHNVAVLCFHPELPIIMAGSEMELFAYGTLLPTGTLNIFYGHVIRHMYGA
jgi:coatomer subunit beta'